MGRTKSVYAVMERTRPTTWEIVTYVADTETGRKWIKTGGVAGHTYLIAAFRGVPVTVKVDTVEKRTLVAAPVEAEIPAEEPTEEEE